MRLALLKLRQVSNYRARCVPALQGIDLAGDILQTETQDGITV
jgi:hypothetical protein